LLAYESERAPGKPDSSLGNLKMSAELDARPTDSSELLWQMLTRNLDDTISGAHPPEKS
jgi:hypothetical protein